MKARHPGSFGMKEKHTPVVSLVDQESDEEEVEGLQLWKLLPQLRELPESLVKKLPMSAMFHLNAAFPFGPALVEPFH